ncbi:MAG: NUDIX domain-containing protein [Cyclobacteriaceae bacterium]
MGIYYKDQPRQLVAVDCIIFGFDAGELKVLLIKRDFEPMKGSWSLIGGFLNEQESFRQSAERILSKLTGLGNIYLEQLQAFGEPNRDSEDRVISVAYFALIKIDEQNQNFDYPFEARWFSINEIPELIFDHSKMIQKALDRLQFNARYRPLGFELLPNKFTIPQLQQLYESIYQQSYDRRNFNKKIMSMGLLNKLDEKQKGSSKKGAWLYQFNKEKYDDLAKEGFKFALG